MLLALQQNMLLAPVEPERFRALSMSGPRRPLPDMKRLREADLDVMCALFSAGVIDEAELAAIGMLV